MELNISQGNSKFEWNAIIGGLDQGLWTNARLQIAIKFDEEYNLVPPNLQFLTIPYHPNGISYSSSNTSWLLSLNYRITFDRPYNICY